MKKNSLLMLGDSLVEWGDWQELLPEFHVINRGIAGEHVEELSARLTQELLGVPEPDHILFMAGTNNLLMGSLLFPAIFNGMLSRTTALYPDADVTVNSIMPMALPGLSAQTIEETNRKLQQVAGSHNCRFLDMTAPFTEQCLPITRPCFLNDGVHLSTLGYRIWAAEIRRHAAAAKA
jgi:lysophospholipase L1-like esterase